MNRPSVFSYIDYTAFLRDWIAARKFEDSSYSYAVFAAAGGGSKAALANVISGTRRPRSSTLDAFARAMELTPSERNYLGLLVELANAGDMATRLAVMERLLAAERYGKVRRVESTPAGDLARYLAHWWIPVVREMARLPGFHPDADWVARQLRPRITPTQADEALKTLFELGFLGWDDAGRVVVRDIRFGTEADVRSDAVTRFHKEEVPLLLAGLDVADAADQQVLTATVALEAEMIPEVKARLHAALDQLATVGDARPEDAPGRVYQIAIQLLPVTAKLGPQSPAPEGPVSR